MDPVIVTQRLEAACASLSGLSFDLAQSSDLADLRAALNRLRGTVQLTEARFVTRVAALSDRGEGPNPEDFHKNRGKTSSKEANRSVRNAHVLARFKAVAAALEQGRVSMEHVDALAAIWAVSNDADRSALEADHEELAKLASRLSRRRRPHPGEPRPPVGVRSPDHPDRDGHQR